MIQMKVLRILFLISILLTECLRSQTDFVDPTEVPLIVTPMKDSIFIEVHADDPNSVNPKMIGRTNLPDGTELGVSIDCQTGSGATCIGFSDGDKVIVKNGTFETRPFGGSRKLLRATYHVFLNTGWIMLQSRSVKQVLGTKGEFAFGPLVQRDNTSASIEMSVLMDLGQGSS